MKMGQMYIPDESYQNESFIGIPTDVSNITFFDLYNITIPTSTKSHPGRVLAISLAVIGILANLASLVAICHVPGPFSANQRLIISLLISDLFVSMAALVTLVNKALFPFFLASGEDYGRKLCSYTTLKAFTMTGHSISLLSLVVLSLDHYLAINKPLRYIHLMTGTRASCLIVLIWILASLFGFSDFLLPGEFYEFCQETALVNFCEVGYCTKYETEYLLFFLVQLCFTVMLVLYGQVFYTIYHYQKMAGRHQRQMKRNIKGLMTTLLILGTFLVCWLPYGIFEAYILVKSILNHKSILGQYKLVLKVDYYLYSLWLVNSICDPIIYALRMREVKHGYYRMIRCRWISSVGKKSSRTSSRYLYHRSVSNNTAVENMDSKAPFLSMANSSV